MKTDLETGWKAHLEKEFEKDYMQKLNQFLATQLKQKKIIYPKPNEWFKALNTTPFNKVKVVIIGQDPYHGPGQAHGLSFSVRPEIKVPPSLRNIYKEIENDLGIKPPAHGYLEAWGKQGVLLLNNVLTVEAAKPGSHQKKGWELFTDKAIEVLDQKKENLVFLLWGSPAQKKGAKIDTRKHLVLKSVHPSPLSAYRGFFGSQHFSKTNDYLKAKDLTPINWQLPESPLSEEITRH